MSMAMCSNAVSNEPLRSSSSERLTPSRMRTRSVSKQEILVDQRVHVGVRRRERQPAAPELLVEPQTQQAGAARGLAGARAAPRAHRSADEGRADVDRQREGLVDGDDHHVVDAGALEPGGVAHAAVGLPGVESRVRLGAVEEPKQRQRVLLHISPTGSRTASPRSDA